MPDYNTQLTSSISPTINSPLLPSAARTTLVGDLIPDENVADARGIIIFLNVTAASGTGGLTMSLKALPPGAQAGGIAFATASAAIIATGISTLVVYPGIATAASPWTAVNSVLPPRFSLNVAVGDASSYTYSVAAFLLV